MIIQPFTYSSEWSCFWNHYLPVVNKYYKEQEVLCYPFLNFLFKKPINNWEYFPSKYRAEGWKRHLGSFKYTTDKLLINPFDSKIEVHNDKFIPTNNSTKYKVRLVITPRYREWNKPKNYSQIFQELIDKNPDAILCCRKEDLVELKYKNNVVFDLNDIMHYYHYAEHVITAESGSAACAAYCSANHTIVGLDVKIGYRRHYEANPNFKGLTLTP